MLYQLLFAIFSSAFVQCCFGEIPLENGVLVLDDASFAEAIKENDLLLVEFYAPWCGHCKKLAPEWDMAAAALAQDNALAKLAKVDTVEATGVYKKYEISSFPTIIFFKEGRSIPYRGGRTAEAIVAWVKKHSTSPVTGLESTDMLVEAQQRNDVMILGYFPDLEVKGVKHKRDIFYHIAETVDYLSFFETTEASVAVYLKLLDEDSIDHAHLFILKSFDKDIMSPKPLQLERKIVSEVIMTDYVKSNSYELFPEFSRENAKRIFAPRIMHHGWIITDEDSVDHENHLETIYFLANQYKGKVQFINLPKHNEAYLKQFDVDLNALPALVVMDVQTMTQYPYKGEFEWSVLGEFTTSVLNGSAERYRKSEEVTAEDTTGPVTILRASSFDDLVLNGDQDVLIFFHATWCGHCKNFSPIYDQLGELFQSSKEKVLISKIDSIDNDIDDIMEGIEVESFPTLYYVTGTKGKKMASLYEGGRELADLVDYINANSGTSVEVPEEQSEQPIPSNEL